MQTTMTTGNPVLTMEGQFHADLTFVSSLLPQEEEVSVVERARQGETEARDALLLMQLPYVRVVARKYAAISSESGHHRLEYLDLIQVGSLALVEHLDQALEHPNPCGYLCRCAAGAIIRYCRKYASLVVTLQGPKGHYLPTFETESLDAPRMTGDGEEYTLAAVLASTDDLDQEPAQERDYTPLYRSLDDLSDACSFVVKRHYGFRCAPESLVSVSNALREYQGKPAKAVTHSANDAYRYHARALTQLRERLASVYAF
jgi:DNA-directed RNA polymerase specialized sigma24 family protein